MEEKNRYLSLAYWEDLERRLREAFGDRAALIEEFVRAHVDRHEDTHDHQFRDLS